MPGTVKSEASSLRATMQVRCGDEWLLLRRVEFGRRVVAESIDGKLLSFLSDDLVEIFTRNHRPLLTAIA